MRSPPEQDDDLLGVVADRWGRIVVFTQSRLTHIHLGHVEVTERDVKLAIRDADIRTRGHRPGDEVLWCRHVGVARWMKVVVAYEAGEGRVRTAYPSRRGPADEDRIE